MNDDYMISFQNETKQTIEASYKKMTAVERSVADFLLVIKMIWIFLLKIYPVCCMYLRLLCQGFPRSADTKDIGNLFFL